MLPQKKYYRQRAHSNPIADHCFDYPSCPEEMDWSTLYPPALRFSGDHQDDNTPPQFVDVGCGYGGLLVELSPRYPSKKVLGIEIRVKVSDYVQDRIKALRLQGNNNKESEEASHDYRNIACIRSNAMKYLPNFFPKGSIEKMFFLFPDPHFKKQKYKWRIISQQLLAEYAYVLEVGARVYIATDVEDLYNWMVGHFTQHPLFEPLAKEDEDIDPIIPLLFDSTEEGKKVSREGRNKFIAVFVRIDDPIAIQHKTTN